MLGAEVNGNLCSNSRKHPFWGPKIQNLYGRACPWTSVARSASGTQLSMGQAILHNLGTPSMQNGWLCPCRSRPLDTEGTHKLEKHNGSVLEQVNLPMESNYFLQLLIIILLANRAHWHALLATCCCFFAIYLGNQACHRQTNSTQSLTHYFKTISFIL